MDIFNVVSIVAHVASQGSNVAADVEYTVKSSLEYTNHGAPVTEMSYASEKDYTSYDSYQETRVEHWEAEE